MLVCSWYANQIELHSDCENMPRGRWWIIAVADVRMRSEHMENRLRNPIQIRVSTQCGLGIGSSLLPPAIVTSGLHTSKIEPTNTFII